MKSFWLAALIFVAAGTVHAGDLKPYSMDALKMAQMDGRTVVLDFHAGWCPVCRKQEAAFKSLKDDADFDKVTVLTVDFDKEKELRRQYGVQQQSTLVVLKDGKEVAREGGITDAGKIKMLVAKGK